MNTAKGIKPCIHARICSLFAAIALTSAASLPAQQLFERETYEKRMTSAKTVEALGSELFGDSVSLQTGALSFSAVDIDLPGNNALPVRFGRSYSVVNSRDDFANHAMRDWMVQLPRISGRFGTDWLGAETSPNRCSDPGNPSLPPDLAPHFMANSYYQGMQLDIPGVGGGELLKIASGVAQPAGGAVMTVDGQIQVQCFKLPANTQGTTGEGFLVLMPDGTRYRFDWMATRGVAPLQAPRNDTSSPNPGSVELPINERSMYPTRVEDRFGNFVEYTYANAANEPVRVTRIRSSDNRQIDVGYDASNSRVVSASANGRTWSYHYENDASPNGRLILRRVTLPDAKTWEINFQSLSYAPIVADTRQGALEEQSCFNQALPRNLSPGSTFPSELIGSITHPSGATGTFRVGLLEHGKSNVTLSCNRVTTTPPTAPPGTGNITSDDVNLFAISSYSWTLLDKQISGTGVALQRWQYEYESDISAVAIPPGSYNFPVCIGAQCYVPTCTSDSCAGTARTLITRPDGSKERYVFGNSWQYNEGKLLRIERLDVTPPNTPEIVLESTTDTYLLNHGTQAFPRYFGRSMRVNQDGFDAENHRPKIATTITRDGVNFTWSVASCGNLCMDALARPTQVNKRSSNSQSGSELHTKTEAYEYEDNNALWVLGQLRRTQVNGIESARADYYPGTALLQNVYIFGMLKQRLEYNADGTMSAIFDGKNQRTGLSNWYRGVPRTVTYHDQTSESATVDANGWITSTTDPRQRTTGFGYDAMGDLTSITPPFNPDGPAWAATSIAFERITTPQFGLSANHWRQSTTRGNYRQDAYYDALYRPVLVHETTTNGSGVNRFVVKSFDLMNREQFTAFPRETLGTVAEATTGVRRTFDAIGRVLVETQDSELGALTTQIDYLAGFRKRITNPRGKQTEYDFQVFDQPSDELPMQIIAPAGQTTIFNRDVFGKATRIARTALIDNVSTTVDRRYVYDSGQRLCKRIEPETGAHVVDYDAADNVLWTAHGLALTDASNCNRANVPLTEQIARSYDGRNRLLLINYPDATADTSYSYFADGALQTASRSGSTWSYEYNTLGLRRTETLSYAGNVRSFAYAYNSSGHLSSTTYPATTLYPTGEVVSYSPNGLGEPTQVGAYAGGIAHYAVGAVRQATLGNGTAFNRELNVRRLPTRLSYVRGGDTQVDLSFGFDANSNVAAINDLRPGGTDSQSFGYDDLDRLTQATAPGSYQSAVFEYDAFDNLRRHQLGNRDHRYRYTDGTNRLTAIQTAAGASVQSFLYDARGNATSTAAAGSATISTEYDRADTLTRLTGPQNEQYRYDAHGHRIEVTSGGVTRYPVYTKDGLLRAEYGPGETDTYYYLGTQQIARLRNNLRVDLIFRSGFEALGSIMEKLRQYVGLKTFAVTYYLNDHLGSTIATASATASATGQVIERSLFAPYGERWGLPTTRGLGFTGHFEDATSLTYMKARYYGSVVGRFNSPDPVLTDPTSGRHFNRYWYADGNPQKFVDPDGRVAWFAAAPATLSGAASACAASSTCVVALGVTTATVTAIAADNIATMAYASAYQNNVFNAPPDTATEGSEGTPEKTGLRGKGVRSPDDPVDLEEALAAEEVIGQLAAGEGENMSDKMNDPRYNPITGSQDKVRGSHSHPDGTVTEVHADRDRATGALSDVKIKDPPDNKKSRFKLRENQ